MSTANYDPRSFEANAMLHRNKGPAEKFDVPCTRAQEIGWLISNPTTLRDIQKRARNKKYQPPASTLKEETQTLQHSRSSPSIPLDRPHDKPNKALGELNNRRFYKPRSFCPITKYADIYVSLMHEDPFAAR